MWYKNTELWNDQWKFYPGDGKEEDFASPEHNDDTWQAVTLPHDWDTAYAPTKESKAGAGGGYAHSGIGWYRKHFVLTKADLKQHLSFIAEGIYMDSTIYLNGQKIGNHIYGYSTFALALDEAAKEGDNLLAIRVNNSRQPGSRWYTGSGIFRDVYLRKMGDVSLTLFGGRVDPGNVVNDQMAVLFLKTKVENSGSTVEDVQICWKLKDRRGRQVASVSAGLVVQGGQSGEAATSLSVEAPDLWSPQSPCLYTLDTILLVNGKAQDEHREHIGIREGKWSADCGFTLNGQPLKIKGVCLHHDSGLFGAAFHKEVWQERLQLLKDMGANGIRCAHNPPAPGLLELCDELGFVVMDEIFDEWMLGKNKNENYFSDQVSYGVAQHFTAIAEEEMKAMMFRDYNHPSVILWSIGNEIPEQSSPSGKEIARKLTAIVHELDPLRPATSACDNIAAPATYETRDDFLEELDVVGYNYVGRWKERAERFYEDDKLAHPERIMIGSENPSVGGDRGDYSMSDPLNRNYTSATLTHEALWRFTASRNYVAGDFIWTGIDYLGEAPWPRRGANSGPIDTAGFEKDTFYYLRSIWNEEETTLHVLPHWSFDAKEKGQFKNVVIYTNCEKVRLYVNGRLVGEKGSARCPRYGATKAWNDEYFRYHPTTGDLHLSFDVPFEEGELVAEGYIGKRKVK
nr:glycoside hydrolase family 2 protein [Lachnospiraceae bacterium]